MWITWLIIIFLLAVIEAITINLVSIWFIISGLISLLLSFFIKSFYIEFGVFVTVGTILMLLTRPFLVHKLKVKSERTNTDRVIGMRGLVTEKIDKEIVGEVKVDGKTWSAISNTNIPVGTFVIIDAIDGVKLKVRKERV